ncbi:MAG: hypothetical protein JOZ38_10430 [Candidatus Eremiobacteraeota bacterium]|nr:hypothetical protein [Candidatus Eremiobacteraeota bacterium]
MKSRFVGLLAAVLFTAGPAAVFAQAAPATPVPAAVPTVPPNAGPVVNTIIDAVVDQVKSDMGWNDNHAIGTVTYFRRFEMQVRFPNGTYREVHLHQGTVINPRGATIAIGNRVDVRGTSNADGSINAGLITIR